MGGWGWVGVGGGGRMWGIDRFTEVCVCGRGGGVYSLKMCGRGGSTHWRCVGGGGLLTGDVWEGGVYSLERCCNEGTGCLVRGDVPETITR